MESDQKKRMEPIYPIGDKGFVKRSDVIKLSRDGNVIFTVDYNQDTVIHELAFIQIEAAMAAMKSIWTMYEDDSNSGIYNEDSNG